MVINYPRDIEPDLTGIIVMSHGPLAKALVDSSRMIVGEASNIASISLEDGDDVNSFRQEFIKMYDSLPGNPLVLIDIKGGTPFNQILFAIEEAGMKNILALSGANLCMLVEAAFARKDASDKQLLKQIKQAGQESILDVGELAERLKLTDK